MKDLISPKNPAHFHAFSEHKLQSKIVDKLNFKPDNQLNPDKLSMNKNLWKFVFVQSFMAIHRTIFEFAVWS